MASLVQSYAAHRVALEAALELVRAADGPNGSVVLHLNRILADLAPAHALLSAAQTEDAFAAVLEVEHGSDTIWHLFLDTMDRFNILADTIEALTPWDHDRMITFGGQREAHETLIGAFEARSA